MSRALASYHPASMPVFSRASYRRELAAWALLPVMAGVVEGGVTGVIVKNVFNDVAPPTTLNLAVAILSGTPALASITSSLWAALSHRKHKIKFLWTVQLLTVALVSMIALVPTNALGLGLLVAGAVGTRVLWTGIMMIRTTVWRANYPRHIRARMAGNLATVQSLVMLATGLSIGAAINFHDQAFRALFPVAGILGLIGALIYKRLRIRGHETLLKQERADNSGSLANPLRLRQILLDDLPFRRYMSAMFVFGIGNLMVLAPLVVMLKDRFELDALTSVLIVTSIPMLMMPVFVPMWSKLLDRVHIVRYRAVHSWSFIASSVMFLVAALSMNLWLLFIAAVLKGAAVSGGVLGWNLGHHDFAPPERAAQYMSVHVTLTGIRGITAPVISISVYQLLEWWAPGNGAWVFALCAGISTIGAISFVIQARTMRRENGHGPDQYDIPPGSKTVSNE